MKKGISKILVFIVALLLGIIIGIIIVKFTMINQINEDINENEEEHLIKILGLDVINRVATTMNKCIIYPIYGYELGINEGFLDTEFTDTSIKVIKGDKSSEITHTDGKIVKMKSACMHSGSFSYRLFITENGSVYYVMEDGDDIDIKKIEGLSGVKDVIGLPTFHVYNEGRFDILETYTFNTAFAILEDNKAYDLFYDIK